MVELKEIKKQIDNVRNKYNDYSYSVKIKNSGSPVSMYN